MFIPACEQRLARFLIITMLSYAGWLPVGAQSPAADSFDPGPNGSVYALAVQPDGRMLVGGNFTWAGGTTRGRVARFDPDGELDSSFSADVNGGYASVLAVAVQADGGTLVGGTFTSLGGASHINLGRVAANGIVDDSFTANVNGQVSALAVQADGKILVGGGFSTLGGEAHNNLGRLNSDGTVDSAFNPYVSGGTVDTLAVQPDGKILVGGWFSVLGDSGHSYLGRLNADGSLDAGFTAYANYAVESLAVQADGKILVGGRFNALGGATRNNLGRLESDGTLDSSFNPAPNGIVYSLALQADGRIVAGGMFSSLGGQSCPRVGRLDANGVLDVTFTAGVDVYDYALALQSDGKLLVGGAFNLLGGLSRMNLGRLESAGAATNVLSADATSITWERGGTAPEVWRTTFESSTNGTEWTLLGAGARVPGGWHLDGLTGLGLIRARGYTTGGMYNSSGGIVESLIGRPVITLHPASSSRDAGAAAEFTVEAVGSQPFSYQWRFGGENLTDADGIDGATTSTLSVTGVWGAQAGGYAVIVSNAWGCVTSLVATLTVADPYIDSDPQSRIGQKDGACTFSVSAVGTALSYLWRKDGVILEGATDAALTLNSVQADDAGTYDVIVSGTYGSVTSAVAVLTVNLAVRDPALSPFNSGHVNALAMQPDGKLLIGGSWLWPLDGAQNGSARSLVRLNASGMLDTGFSPVLDSMSAVYALAVQPDGKILLGGWFSTVDGSPRQNIARLNADGTLDHDFAPDSDGSVYALAVLADGGILVGGAFGSLGGASCANVGKLDAFGVTDTAFVGSADSVVQTLAVQTDGKILLGGAFNTLDSQSRACLGRLNADGSLDAGFAPNASSTVYSSVVAALAVQADGRILVGGTFNTLDGVSRSYLGRLDASGTVDPAFAPEPDGDIRSLVLQANGGILIGGNFTLIGGAAHAGLARLDADGNPDAFFNPSVPSGLQALAVQSDGDIVVGGSIWTLNEEDQVGVGCLKNADATGETLSFSAGTITWLRTGGLPEVWRTTFESTTNSGALWNPLGEGERTAGGWKLDGVPAILGTVRARGFTAGGSYDGSGGIIESGMGAPLITGAPTSSTNVAGSAVAFSAWVIGSAPLSYQWRKNGVNIADGGNLAGSASATLRLSGVLGADAGDYDLLVSNADGCVTSVVATLTVFDPVILDPPFTQTGELGGDALFGVVAAGTELHYQWQRNGASLTGATSDVLTVTGIQVSDVGFYSVVVSGAYGCVTSAVVALEVNLVQADPGFLPEPDGQVVAMATQPDGKILFGGDFSHLGTAPCAHLARFNSDGTPDNTFSTGADAGIWALAVQPDGGLLAGGWFSSLGGGTRNFIGRLDAQGTLDTGFNPGANNGVCALAVQPDGGILVGGWFSSLGGSTCNYLGRLSAAGALDTGFNPDPDGVVYSLLLQEDGGILVGGAFGTLGGSTHSHLGRLSVDGNVDDTFNPELDGPVYALAVQADGKILVGGSFATANGEARNCIARLNADGSLDGSFSLGLQGYQVNTLVLQANGTIVMGGAFWELDGHTRSNLARLKADGTLDPGFTLGADNEVKALCVQADGGVLVGGLFGTLVGESRSLLARLLASEPATDSLSYEATTTTWLRGGAAPEVCRTTFEYTTNGVDWVPMGAGSRIAGGWQLSGVSAASMPVQARQASSKMTTSSSGGSAVTGTLIRARGYVSCGTWNGSGGIVESTLLVSTPTKDADGDGIPDWWTLLYFGHPTGQEADLSRATDDAVGTGQSNHFKYVAGLDPTNSASVFRLDLRTVPGQASQRKLIFSPRWGDRFYTPQMTTNLVADGSWTNLTSSITDDNSSERTVIDVNAEGRCRFYRILITLP